MEAFTKTPLAHAAVAQHSVNLNAVSTVPAITMPHLPTATMARMARMVPTHLHASPAPRHTALAAIAAIPLSALPALQVSPYPRTLSAASMLAATSRTASPAQGLPAAISVRPVTSLLIALQRSVRSVTARSVQARTARAVCMDTRLPVMELACPIVEADAQTASLQEYVPNAKVGSFSTLPPIPACLIAAPRSEETANLVKISSSAASVRLATCPFITV